MKPLFKIVSAKGYPPNCVELFDARGVPLGVFVSMEAAETTARGVGAQTLATVIPAAIARKEFAGCTPEDAAILEHHRQKRGCPKTEVAA